MRKQAVLGGVLALVGVVAAAFGGDDAVTTTYRLERLDGKAPTAADANSVLAVIERRLTDAGDAGVAVKVAEATTITVTIWSASATQREEILRLVERPGTLEFRICAPEAEKQKWREISDELGGPLVAPKRFTWVPLADGPGDSLVVTPERAIAAEIEKARTAGAAADAPAVKALQTDFERALHDEVFTGEQLEKAELRRHAKMNVVYFAFRDARRKPFTEFTEKHVKEQMAIILDGKVKSAPFITSALPGEGVIQGGGAAGFSLAEARALVSVLSSGALPVRLVRVETPEKK